MTEDELRAIEERAEKATHGPWATVKDNGILLGLPLGGQAIARIVWSDAPSDNPRDIERGVGFDIAYFIELGENNEVSNGNAAFTAHARTDIPALVAEVRRLRGWVEYAAAPTPSDGMAHHAQCSHWQCRALRGEPAPEMTT